MLRRMQAPRKICREGASAVAMGGQGIERRDILRSLEFFHCRDFSGFHMGVCVRANHVHENVSRGGASLLPPLQPLFFNPHNSR